VPDTLRRLAADRRTEVLLTAALIASAVGEVLVRGDAEHPLPVAVAVAVAAATLLVRRAHPVAATTVAATVVALLPSDVSPTVLALVLPLLLSYSCGAHAAVPPGLAATVALTLAIQLHVGFSDAPNLEIAIATLPPWWGGMQVRRRRELVRELQARTRELAAEEEAFVRLSVQRERARIARDLHDIVSHHLAVMVIQAGAGRLAQPWRADVVAARFDAIRDAGRQALAEADRLVTMLQSDGGPAVRLAHLLERASAAGARVVVTPPDLRLRSETEAIAYRVAQEALTNAMKHAPGAAVEIDVSLAGGELTITVRNDAVAEGSEIAATGSGLGLRGMRERLGACHGELVAGADPAGGFRLCARLPVP
jgi:signal transduction histidine kinase